MAEWLESLALSIVAVVRPPVLAKIFFPSFSSFPFPLSFFHIPLSLRIPLLLLFYTQLHPDYHRHTILHERVDRGLVEIAILEQGGEGRTKPSDKSHRAHLSCPTSPTPNPYSSPVANLHWRPSNIQQMLERIMIIAICASRSNDLFYIALTQELL